MRKGKERPLVSTVKKYISSMIKSLIKVCDKPLIFLEKHDCGEHVNTKKHSHKEMTEYMLDLPLMPTRGG